MKMLMILSVIPRIHIVCERNENYESYSEFPKYPLFNKNIIVDSIKDMIKNINKENKLEENHYPPIQMDYNEKIFTFEYLDNIINLKLPLYYIMILRKSQLFNL